MTILKSVLWMIGGAFSVALLFMASCGDNKSQGQAQGIGNNCFPDISNCDISGNYSLTGTDVMPLFIYSAGMPISQNGQTPSEVSIAPSFYFYTASNTYIFRSVGAGTWDGDSLKATINGKLRLSATNYPIVGGFTVTIKLDAKQKTFTTAQYYSSQIDRLTLPAMDGTMIISDSANVIFPALDTKSKAMFTQF